MEDFHGVIIAKGRLIVRGVINPSFLISVERARTPSTRKRLSMFCGTKGDFSFQRHYPLPPFLPKKSAKKKAEARKPLPRTSLSVNQTEREIPFVHNKIISEFLKFMQCYLADLVKSEK